MEYPDECHVRSHLRVVMKVPAIFDVCDSKSRKQTNECQFSLLRNSVYRGKPGPEIMRYLYVNANLVKQLNLSVAEVKTNLCQ